MSNGRQKENGGLKVTGVKERIDENWLVEGPRLQFAVAIARFRREISVWDGVIERWTKPVRPDDWSETRETDFQVKLAEGDIEGALEDRELVPAPDDGMMSHGWLLLSVILSCREELEKAETRVIKKMAGRCADALMETATEIPEG